MQLFSSTCFCTGFFTRLLVFSLFGGGLSGVLTSRSDSCIILYLTQSWPWGALSRSGYIFGASPSVATAVVSACTQGQAVASAGTQGRQ